MILGNLEGHTLGGRYEIQSLIGQGGMAAVYKAYDPNLHRAVAIKIIHPHLSNNPDFTHRFEEEATIVAHLRHPNIIQVFDFNHDDNLYYMVMEYIAGETLQTRLMRLSAAKRQMPVKDAVRFAAEICDAAEYAHQRGMIHRDIKPANVMLDVHGRAILMDFGIARIVGGSQHTATGAVVGTALYMAPEQIQGLQVDARTDIYALGVTLFEMLSGRPPFQADSAMTLMMMHLNDPVPDLCALQPETPVQVVGIIEKAMAKDRDERFQSAAKMAAQLRGADTDPGKPKSMPASVPFAADMDATLIEAAVITSPDGTLIEAAVITPPDGTLIEAPPAMRVQAQAHPQSMPASGSRAQPGIAGGVKSTTANHKQEAPFPATPGQSAFPVQPKRSKAWIIILPVLLIGLGAAGFFAFQQISGSRSLAADGNLASLVAAEASHTPTSPGASMLELTQAAQFTQAVAALAVPVAQENTAVPEAPTSQVIEVVGPTALPSATATETAIPTPAAPVIGGADKIAFISGGDIWVANLDGSELTQLTETGGSKGYLRWLPDGQGLSYISGKCIRTISLGKEDQVVTCFNNAKYLESFEVSPDGSQVAISLDNQLYLVPFDLLLLKEAKTHGDLANLAGCKELAPYARNFGRSVRWSQDGTQWAALILGVLKDGRRGDLIQVFAVDRCIPNPLVTAQFPEPHFTYKTYQANPAIENFSWDGNSLFVFNDIKRNDGFGDLHIFNMEKFLPILSVNPINNTCCYRDAQWSPDGSHLVFAFQNYLQGSNSTTQFYLIPYGDIGTGVSFKPLPLPEISDPREKPQPVLRPAINP